MNGNYPINNTLKHKIMKVFLGGTCGDSTWRNDLIPKLKIEFFNPQLGVGEWTPAHSEIEEKEKDECDICLYVISPETSSMWSIAEVVDDSNKRPKKTVFFINVKDEGLVFSKHELNALDKIGILVLNNGGLYFESYNNLINYLNTQT